MNASATSGEEESTVKKGDGENGKHTGIETDHVTATATQTLTGSDGKSAGVTTPDMSSTASVEDSGSSPQATTQPEGSGETAPDELPRRRRGILLGTRPGQATPAAVDDGKSLSWMATQAVKAANAVKASQLEQAQAWKAGTGTSEDEQSRLDEDGVEAIEAGESFAMPTQESVQPSPGEASATTDAVSPVESSQVTAATPRIPPGARAAAARVPARMALMLGVLLMFSYAGYRHWFSGDRATSDVTVTSSAIIEPAGPAEEADLMTPPAISVVAAPQPSTGSTKPEAPAVEAGTAPTPAPTTDAKPATATAPGEPAGPAAEEVKLMTPPPISVVPAPEPATEQSSPPAVEAGLAPMPGSATGIQPATVGVAPQPAPAYPASTTKPEAWYPSAVPGAPSPAAEAGMNARESVPPSSLQPVEATVPASQPTSPSSPPPAVEAKAPARPAATPAPAAQPRYPANGYGYYPPPTSWQPYYRPGYPQAPARQ